MKLIRNIKLIDERHCNILSVIASGDGEMEGTPISRLVLDFPSLDGRSEQSD